jgi:hypothetical protein
MHDLKKNWVVYFLTCLSIILLSSPQISAATNVGGIINTNTTWTSANSPYTLTNNVQIASGITLSIEPGVVVYGNNYRIENWGTFSAVGNSSSRIIFNDLYIQPGTNGMSAIIIQFANIQRGSISGYYGSVGNTTLTLKDSRLYSLASQIYLWYPGECYIERNIFSNSPAIYVIGGLFYIRNNVFVNSTPSSWSECASSSICLIVGGGGAVIEYNSFLKTDEIAIAVAAGYSTAGQNTSAINNYWNTTDTNIINNITAVPTLIE